MQPKKPIKKLLFQAPALDGDKETSKLDYSFELKIGDGAFGQVWRVKHKKTSKLYACKQVSKEKVFKMLEQFRREVMIMYEISHPHIIRLYHHFEDLKYFYLIMELAEGGSLFSKLVTDKNFGEKVAFQYFCEVLSAVEYLHMHNPAIIHRDIKPENILLDKKGSLKLTDFGWSNFSEEGVPRYTMCGTYEYLAPEMVKETGHTPAIDVWCLGILLFELFSGYTPFKASSKELVIENITKGKIKFPKNVPAQAKDLISKILERNPSKRISIEKIKSCDWYKSFENKKVLPPNPVKGNIHPISIPETGGKAKIESLRRSLNKIQDEISTESHEMRSIKEKILSINKLIRENTRILKLTEQKILKKRIESLDLDHGNRETGEYISDARVQLEKCQSDVDLKKYTTKILEIQEKTFKLDEESKTYQEKAKDLSNEVELVSENLTDRERYYANLLQYFKKLKAKGSGLHRSKASQVSSLQASCEFLKNQINEHEKIVEMMETGESRVIREIMNYIKSAKDKITSHYFLEEKLKNIEDLAYLKEVEIEKLKVYYTGKKNMVHKVFRVDKEKILKETLDKSMRQERKNKEIYEMKESLRNQIALSRGMEKKYILDTIDLENTKNSMTVIYI